MADLTKRRFSKASEEINAKMDLNVDADLFINKAHTKTPKKYRCTCCGASWDNQKGHFGKSSSIMYRGNDGYINICNSCRDEWYVKLVEFYKGNEAHAIRHICQQFDILFNEESYIMSKSASTSNSRIGAYFSKKNLGSKLVGGDTYIDGLIFQFEKNKTDIINSREQIKEEDITVKAVAIDRWGIGYSEIDYNILDEHYKMLKKNNPNADSNQEIFIKSLCELNLLKVKAMKNDDPDKVIKLTEQYSKTFKQAGLKTVEDDDRNIGDCWGMFMEQISQYTPEEYYKDKKLYKDFDGIGEMFSRFVLRPLKNIITGSAERDIEYNVEDEVNG